MPRAAKATKSENATGGQEAVASDELLKELEIQILALLRRGTDGGTKDVPNENALDPKEMNPTIANGIKLLTVKYRIIGSGEEGDFWDQ